ncbi:hypothetical protein [Streptomyces sp. RK9]|uniref:hypothetical protein n=1 Tax=Streptomyces sp. RK9 TaxID=3239284 RepID=UPI00386CC746
MTPMKMRVTAPLDGFNGEGVGGLLFVDGTATTSDLAIIGYCQGAGYRVEPLDGQSDEPAGRSAARKRG